MNRLALRNIYLGAYKSIQSNCLTFPFSWMSLTSNHGNLPEVLLYLLLAVAVACPGADGVEGHLQLAQLALERVQLAAHLQ